MSTVLLMIHTKSTVLLISPSQKCHVLPICLGNISTVLPLSLSHQVNCPTYGIYSPCQLFYPLRLLTMSTFLPLSPVYHVKCSTPYTYSPGHLFYPLYVLTRSIVLPLEPTHQVNYSSHATHSLSQLFYSCHLVHKCPLVHPCHNIPQMKVKKTKQQTNGIQLSD